MKTPSEAEPAAAAESHAGAPRTHRGLTYPFGRAAPDFGALSDIARDVRWTRLPVPGRLGHINIWLLDDGAALTIVDSGLAIDAARAAWTALLEGPLAGRAIARILATHFHPDHVGLAGWLAGRTGARLWMTRGEWATARMLAADVRETPPPEALAYWRAAGWEEARIAAEATKGWGRFAAAVSPIPLSYRRLRDGETLRIGAREWRVVVGSGHSPEHACLVDVEGRLMIAGDQVLPRITSNVSLSLSEPEADPLGEWLDSIARLKRLPDDLLVLPAHGEPFTGLHARLDALDAGHRGRLDALHALLAEPKRAVDCFRTLFGRAIGDGSYGLATGEALAHLRRLEVEGRARREARGGVWWFHAA